MSKNRRYKNRYKAVVQCQACMLIYCSTARKQECARNEFMAIADGSIYECPEYSAPWEQRVCA